MYAGSVRLKAIEGATEGARAERTANMESMLVTPEVFQLEMSVLKLLRPWKRELMSVMNETSQSAMGPYVAMADATSSL